MKKCRNYVQKSLFNSRTSNSYINIHVRLHFEKAKFLLFSIFHQQRNYRNPIDINFPNPVYRNSIKVIHVYRRFMNISLTREPSIPNFRPIIHTKDQIHADKSRDSKRREKEKKEKLAYPSNNSLPLP